MAGQEVPAAGSHQASCPITTGTAFVVLGVPNFKMISAGLHCLHGGAGSCLGRLAAGKGEAASSWSLVWIPYRCDAKAFLTKYWTQTLAASSLSHTPRPYLYRCSRFKLSEANRHVGLGKRWQRRGGSDI